VVMQMLLASVLERGARLARPGEFTERAYLNGKMDLAQAEAVADLIASASVAAAKGAVKSLRGEFSRRVHGIDERVLQLRLYVEAAIDFPEEEVDFLSEGAVAEKLVAVADDLRVLLQTSRQGALLRDGVTVALVGAPNVGKSSLLNALIGEELAIVTDIPGTTRDLIRADLDLDGLPVEIVDTAGLRESADPVEREGVRRAENQAREADLVLVITDFKDPNECSVSASDVLPSGAAVINVLNKVDKSKLGAGAVPDAGVPTVRVSALTGAGLAELRTAMMRAVGFSAQPGIFTARQRHLIALESALQALGRSDALLSEAASGELIAEELRVAHQALGDIVGEMTADELLGEIFASFCIGK
ncbi:MAG: tRNA uridine-5-carboxymethylaminomethyl(34) synthesis GTPase MnmE, partial [Gammaproteobacteria bacterium]|nr:tRNA uridine-5-carboxymethylaminomethyl(34) synthesis GTPase MnmE [Gammaproteobacteria bacterium]